GAVSGEFPWLETLKQKLTPRSEKNGTLLEMKQQSLDAFVAQGLPRLKDERWKYTQPASFTKVAEPIEGSRPSDSTIDLDEQLEAINIVFIDGQVDANQFSQ